MKILIAEDDLAFQRMLGHMVAKWGHEPVIAQDGEEAWEILQSNDAPRLVLLDWVMPALNGLDVCRRIRSRPAPGYTYVIILTARSEPQDAITALEAGADDFVSKPFQSHELKARVSTAQRILALEQNATERSFYDQLTGLPNRLLLEERFRKSAEGAARNAEMLAILSIDLDHFKMVNNSFGHAVGDTILLDLTDRLKNCLGDTDTLARVGGDEFVCLARVENESAAAALGARVRMTLEQAANAAGHHWSTSASIGISLFPQDGDRLDVLLKNADAAVYEFKRRRLVDGFQFFNEDMGCRYRSRLMLETQLPGALQRNEFVVHYQPILRLKDLCVTGSEALIRWNEPARKAISPDEFIPVAEQTGHIAGIEKWVLDQACRQAKRWEGGADPSFRVAVNISASHFSDGELIDTVSEALARTGAHPSRLELELTETVLVRDLEKSAATIRALRRLGVRVSLDDFGTGYSSLNYLANLPIHTLKIDRSFLFGIHTHDRRFSVLKAIVDLAHKLEILVVAEGIENLHQLKTVRDAGCDEVQGFLFAKPGLPEQTDCVSFSGIRTSFETRVQKLEPPYVFT